LKVLHIWSVAGVAEVIAKFMDRVEGTESTVLVRREFDRFGYNQHSLEDGRYRFSVRVVMASRKADVVQVHNWDRIIPWVKRFSSTPVAVTYHSFNIANEWEERRRYWSPADAKIIATPGLANQQNGALFIPEPVDTDLFSDAGTHVNGTALTSEYGATQEAEVLAKERGLELTVLERDTAPIPHTQMPQLLNRYEYYIDIKRPYKTDLPIIQATGKTCLEALACGCKVIRWDGRVLEGLSQDNRPENVAAEYFAVYSKLMSGKG
jgi:hypothetical protein